MTIALMAGTAFNVYVAIAGSTPAFNWAVVAFCGLATIHNIVRERRA